MSPSSTPASPTAPARYRIEDLAHHSGATVRTIRAYQDRGLLPKPERRGRANVYDDTHLARLHQISGLLERGFTLASIKELLTAWDSGRGLGGVLGLVTEVDGPWSDESPTTLTLAELAARFPRSTPSGEHEGARGAGSAEAGAAAPDTPDAEPVDVAGAVPGGAGPAGLDEEALADALELGVLVAVPGRPEEFHVPSPQELAVAAELHRAGVPLVAVTGHLRELRGQIEHIAGRFLDFTTEHVFARYLDHPPSDTEISEAATLVRRLRPLAQQAVDAELARAMSSLAARHLHRHMAALALPVPARPVGPVAAEAATAGAATGAGGSGTPAEAAAATETAGAGSGPEAARREEAGREEAQPEEAGSPAEAVWRGWRPPPLRTGPAPSVPDRAGGAGAGEPRTGVASVALPAETVRAVRELVSGAGSPGGGRSDQAVAEFVAAAVEREVQARRMDRLAGIPATGAAAAKAEAGQDGPAAER